MSRHCLLRARARRALIVFPSLALVVSVGCASSSQAGSHSDAKRTSTTVKRTVVTTTLAAKGNLDSAGAPTALSVLGKIKIAKEQPAGYSRSLFKHWADADGDSCNTREEVLINESRSNAQIDAYGCKVIEGNWLSPYDNAMHTNPSELDIDHMIPLKEAWDSGARNWSSSQRQLFANDLSDPRPLIAVTAGQNRSKSDRDPSNWIPPNAQYMCIYLAEWVAIKVRWNLSMDQSEFGRIRNLLSQSCASTTISPWGTAAGVSVPNNSGKESFPAVSPNDTVAAVPVTTVNSLVVDTSTDQASSSVRQVSPVRCKKSEFGQTGQYRSVPYVCSDRRTDGSLYVVGYFYWRPA